MKIGRILLTSGWVIVQEANDDGMLYQRDGRMVTLPEARRGEVVWDEIVWDEQE